MEPRSDFLLRIINKSDCFSGILFPSGSKAPKSFFEEFTGDIPEKCKLDDRATVSLQKIFTSRDALSLAYR